ncbi:ribosome hibernation-promoting factor, HPF/YfiA family [Streptomyces xanthophaeus]
MRVEVFGKDVEVTPALHRYVEEKLGHLGLRASKVSECRVTLRTQGAQYNAVATLFVRAGGQVTAQGEGQSVYAAIDLLAGKLETQLSEHLEKQESAPTGPPE